MATGDFSSDENQFNWAEASWSLLCSLRQQSPLIQCITNYVSMDFVANILLAAGASPAMVHCLEEIPDFTPIVAGLCINVGTLTPSWLPAMKSAAALAAGLSKPWVLDPVAAGASNFRLNACLELVGLKPTVIRGNGSEIIALSSSSTGSNKGADSLHSSEDALEAAKFLAQTSGAVVAVSGAVDIITDGQRVACVHNGDPMMQRITATGCAVTGLISAFVAVDPVHAFEATASALSVFGVAGEMGMIKAVGPASLKVHLIDTLYGLDASIVRERIKISGM